jgi:quercetin dioxygenase-like cupin family protein
VEILRFGPGWRRSRPRAGTHGLADQTIWADPRARITELAFSRRALLPPQTSPDLGLLIVIAGGGWVQVGEERTPISHGEAVEWPPGVTHGAWTDGSTMRAILVEVPDAAIEAPHARLSESVPAAKVEPARGRLVERDSRPEDHDAGEGEPW